MAIGTAGSAEKCAFVRARGAAHAIDYSIEPVAERVMALTSGRGADIVFDHVAGKAFTEGLKMVAPLGMIVSYAVLGGMPESDLFAAMRANIERSPAVRCFTMHTYDHMEEPRREAMMRAIDMLGGGKVQPAIATRLPLAEARQGPRADRGAEGDGESGAPRQDRADAIKVSAGWPRGDRGGGAGLEADDVAVATAGGLRVKPALVRDRPEPSVSPTTVSAAPRARKPSRR